MNAPLVVTVAKKWLMKKIVVLGNGPSLKDFDFSTLSKVDSLGMNAAYRYWERIDWYPTHYICLDDQLIETHATAIYEMIIKGNVKSAFLTGKILEYYPDLLDYTQVVYLESFDALKNSIARLDKVAFINSVFFRDSDSSKITTGAYSVRYAAYLGYDAIAIMGVDLDYQELLPEAQSDEGTKLQMWATPSHNPNYFFDDYQQAGDKFNVPNPSSHGCSLHIRSFEVLAYDILQYRWRPLVFNSNEKSEVYWRELLPYIHIDAFIGSVTLNGLQDVYHLSKTNKQRWRPSVFQKLKNQGLSLQKLFTK